MMWPPHLGLRAFRGHFPRVQTPNFGGLRPSGWPGCVFACRAPP